MCERCTFISRCLNRQLTSKRENNLKDFDIKNKVYWEKILKMFEDTSSLITHIAEKQGINLGKMDGEAAAKDLEKRKGAGNKAHNHALSQAAKKYSSLVDDFFEREKGLFVQKENEMNQQLHLGINKSKIEDEANEIKDTSEIISWYTPLIWVKLMRALTGKFDAEEWEDENGYPRDSDGSAKVALIGIDRSIAAWGRLQQLFPEKTDEIISLVLYLDQLRRKIEAEFPKARTFMRPGFDE